MFTKFGRPVLNTFSNEQEPCFFKILEQFQCWQKKELQIQAGLLEMKPIL